MTRSLAVLIPSLAAALGLAACGGSSSSSSAPPPSHPAAGGGSGGRIHVASGHLVNGAGLTLYHLSAEKGGKFICTGTCVQTWHPVLAHGGKPSGSIGSLTAIKRPDGKMQVAYKGEPLYTFAQDTGPGQTNGQGIKDVGTWQVATTGAPKPASSGGGSAPAY